MPTSYDSDDHEEEGDIIAEYENRQSDGENDNANRNVDFDQDDQEEDNETQSTARRIDPSTSKRHIVRNPIPKLNTERLKGPKGIQTIEKYFEGFKFYGKGHEKADLDRVMKRMEHWAHRLFPKLDFDDFLARVEKLGSKKDLQVFIKKYRNDMISADEEVLSKEIIDDEENNEDNEPIDELDMLISEQIEKQMRVAIQQETPVSNTINQNANNNTFDQLLTNTINKTSEPRKESNAPSQLSEEVKARIERNRQEAIQRRMARLQAAKEEAKRKKLESTQGTDEVNESISGIVEEYNGSNKVNNSVNNSANSQEVDNSHKE